MPETLDERIARTRREMAQGASAPSPPRGGAPDRPALLEALYNDIKLGPSPNLHLIPRATTIDGKPSESIFPPRVPPDIGGGGLLKPSPYRGQSVPFWYLGANPSVEELDAQSRGDWAREAELRGRRDRPEATAVEDAARVGGLMMMQDQPLVGALLSNQLHQGGTGSRRVPVPPNEVLTRDWKAQPWSPDEASNPWVVQAERARARLGGDPPIPKPASGLPPADAPGPLTVNMSPLAAQTMRDMQGLQDFYRQQLDASAPGRHPRVQQLLDGPPPITILRGTRPPTYAYPPEPGTSSGVGWPEYAQRLSRGDVEYREAEAAKQRGALATDLAAGQFPTLLGALTDLQKAQMAGRSELPRVLAGIMGQNALAAGRVLTGEEVGSIFDAFGAAEQVHAGAKGGAPAAASATQRLVEGINKQANAISQPEIDAILKAAGIAGADPSAARQTSWDNLARILTEQPRATEPDNLTTVANAIRKGGMPGGEEAFLTNMEEQIIKLIVDSGQRTAGDYRLRSIDQPAGPHGGKFIGYELSRPGWSRPYSDPLKDSGLGRYDTFLQSIRPEAKAQSAARAKTLGLLRAALERQAGSK